MPRVSIIGLDRVARRCKFAKAAKSSKFPDKLGAK
jgi:hypothetical protein